MSRQVGHPVRLGGIPRRLTLPEVLDMLRQEIEYEGGQEAYAAFVGVSQGYISDVLRGRRAPGEKLLAALGLRPVPQPPLYEVDA